MRYLKKIELIKFAVQNSGSLFIAKLLGVGLNYLVLILVLQFFGFELNGELSNFIVQSKGLMVFLLFGLDVVIVKRINQLDKTIESVLETTKTLFLNILIFIVLFNVVNVFYSLDYNYLYGGIILSIWRYISHYYRGKNNMLIYGLFEFIILQLSVLIALIINIFYPSNLIHLILLINVIGLLFVAIIFLKKYYKLINRSLFTFKYNIINLYKESFHFVLSSSIVILSTSVIYLIIKSNYSEEILGIYDTILKFSQIVILPLIATNGRVMALTSKYFNSNNLQELKIYVGKVTKMLVYASTGCAAFVVVMYFVYSEYMKIELQEYWPLFLLMVLSQLINSWAGPVGIVLQLTNNEKKYNVITFLSSTYLVLSTIIVSFYLEIEYIAINYIVFMFIQNLFPLLIMKKRLNINPYKL